MTIVDHINQGIKDSMLKRDQIRLDTLRMLKSKILAIDARCTLPDNEVQKLFKTYYGNLQETLEQAEVAKRSEIIERLKVEMAIVQEFLPKALSHEELKEIVEQAIVESGAKTKKDLGQVMKAIMKINNSVDGKAAKDVAGRLLAD